MNNRQDTHSVAVGYIVWIFGFFGAHRFYYGHRITGTIWFLTLGLLGYVHSNADRHQAALQAFRLAQLTMPAETQWKRDTV